MMLHKSGHNLKGEAINFIRESETITLFSAYIKLEELKYLNEGNKIKLIVVRWEVQDLCVGASDLELYDYCIKHDIILFRNTRIHLKAIWDGNKRVVFGSANITGRGIGERGNNYNFELNGIANNISLDDRLYLESIINNSEIVDEELYRKLLEKKEEFEDKEIMYPKIETIKREKDYFLISQLPMSTSPDILLDTYFGDSDEREIDVRCMLHDMATFNIVTNQDRDMMKEQLKNNFNSHEFIISLKNAIKESQRKSLNYGSVVRWIQENTTTVPTPRSWELKKDEIVNILYDWICYFDDDFSWDRPGHSQIIYYHAFNENDIV